MGLFDVEFWKKREPSKDKQFMHGLYDGLFTLFFKPNDVTQGGTHIKGPMDLKRLMIHVVIALQLCYVLGAYNIGHQHFLALGQHMGVLDAIHLKLIIGLMVFVAYIYRFKRGRFGYRVLFCFQKRPSD